MLTHEFVENLDNKVKISHIPIEKCANPASAGSFISSLQALKFII